MILAPGRGIDTSAWFSLAGLRDGAVDLGRGILYVAGTAALATMVGVLARSVAVGSGAALLWTGPLENILGDDWAPAAEAFPGLQLRGMLNPGSTGVAARQVTAAVAVYLVAAVAISAFVLRRRDVTA